jgi:HEAT repeat protein
LLEDDSAPVQAHAALALGKLGPSAVGAGEALLQASKTGEAAVREQAMRALAMIQPPEAEEAFAAGLKDASIDVRVLASAGWLNAEAVPDRAAPALIEGLRDPEARVRANAASALARLDAVPAEAVALLVDCASDPSDALRLGAVQALKKAPPGVVAEVMGRLTSDPNARVRLTAAAALLEREPGNAEAAAVLLEALAHRSPGVRDEAFSVFESLGEGGGAVVGAVQEGAAPEPAPEASEVAS